MTTTDIMTTGRPWDLQSTTDLALAHPLALGSWSWRIIEPDHPVLGSDVLVRRDPGGVFDLIADELGTPEAWCVLGGNVASASSWPGVSYDQQYAAVSRGAGVFPCGGMLYLTLSGPDAVNVLDVLTPRNIATLDVGQSVFAVFLTTEGTVETEGVVLRTDTDTYVVSVGGDTRVPSWLHDAVAALPEVSVAEGEVSSFNIKGPQQLDAALALIDDASQGAVAALRPFRAAAVRTKAGNRGWVMRTLIGTELWGDEATMHEAWTRMLAHPEIYTPCGWDVLASYRLECTDIVFYLCPLDIHRLTPLHDVGLGSQLSHRKNQPYVGRDAALASTGGPRLRVAGLVSTGHDDPVRHVGDTIRDPGTGDPVGYVTTAGWMPARARQGCFAHLLPGVGDGVILLGDDGTQWVTTPLPITDDDASVPYG